MKIVLAGTPQIAIATFKEIIKHHNVMAIITQPDKKQGRGLKLKATVVAELAKKYKIQVFKPIKIDNIYEQLKALNFDLLLTFAYGQFLSSRILSLGNFWPVNIHASLLPKYRGAAPIHYAILNGDKEIGITLTAMVAEMDAGSIYFQAQSPINEDTNFDQAVDIISNLAKQNINNWLTKIVTKNVIPYQQPSSFTYAPKITKSQRLIDDNLSVLKAKRKIRAFTSLPGTFTFIDGVRYKLFDYLDDYKDGCLELKLRDGKLFINDFQKASRKRHKII